MGGKTLQKISLKLLDISSMVEWKEEEIKVNTGIGGWAFIFRKH
jgi:hypothetical protein